MTIGAKVTICRRTCTAILLLFIVCGVFGQLPNAAVMNQAPDSIDVSRLDSLVAADLDTTFTDTGVVDSVKTDSILRYSISPQALDGEVIYSVRDSMHYSVAEQKIYLYGGAEVKYADLTLASGYMVIDNRNNIVIAEPIVDSLGVKSELPSFEQGQQAFTAQGMRYNFKTRKGIITNARTEQGDLFVLGGKTKIVAADPNDPERTDNTVYNSDAIITTCDLHEPHYGIHSTKQKVVPGKLVIVGPSNVELGGVPTPLWLPFGFFPIGSSERSGLLFPKDYTYTDIDGFGFQQVGWYFPWNEHIHSSVTTDVFLRGTFRADVTTDYAKRYKHQGGFDLGWSRNRQELNGVESFGQAFSVFWRHQQDRKANPYRTFSANVQFQTNDYARTNRQDFASQVTSTISSSVNYSIKFPEHPTWALTAGLQHSQNTNTREVDVQAPNIRFSTGAMYPFADVGTDPTAWFKKAQLTYTAETQGNLEGTDTTFFQQKTLDEALFGARHTVSFAAPINVLKYFRLSPNITYSQNFYLDRFQATIRDSIRVDSSFTVVNGDTVVRQGIPNIVRFRDLDTLSEFQVAQNLSASLSLSTQVFGTARVKVGKLQGVRHIMTPSINFGYAPDYEDGLFDYYDEPILALAEGGTIDSALLDPVFRFPNRPFASGATSRQRSLQVGYSLGNRIETKLRNADSTSRIVALINNLNFSGSYNFEADSLRWSPVNVSGAQLTLFRKLLRLNISGGQFGIYERNENGQRIRTTRLQNGKFPLRFDAVRLALSTRLTVGEIRNLITNKEHKTQDTEIFSLIDKFGISYNYARSYNRFRTGGTNTPWETSASSVNINGSIPLTEKWQIRGIALGYDFRNERITYPQLSLYRDLHCWEMDFFWAPRLNTFTFSIRVKPSSLGFLEVPYRRGSRF